MKEKFRQKKLAILICAVLAMALIVGFAIPKATACESITVSKTAAADEDTALQWDLTLDVTGSQSSDPKIIDILLIIDNSGSMRGSKLTAAKAAACDLVDALAGNPDVDAQFALAYFSNQGHVASSDYSSDATTVKGWINGISDASGTNIAAGLMAGRSITGGARSEAAKYAVLLSDGEPNRFAVSDADTYYRKSGSHYYALATGYNHEYTYNSNNVYMYSGSTYKSFSQLGLGDPDFYLAKIEAGKLKSAGFTVYTVGLELDQSSATDLLKDISSNNSVMLGDADDLAAIFASIVADIQLAGTDGYVIDQVPDYLTIVPGTFQEYVNGTLQSGTPDVSVSGNQITWNIGGDDSDADDAAGDINTKTKTLKFTVQLMDEAAYTGSSYDYEPTASLSLNTSATLYYTDKDDVDRTLPFSPMPTGVVPGISIDKSADKATALPGDTITYTFKVKNLVDAPLKGVTITDAMFPSEAQFAIGDMAANEEKTVTVQYTVPQNQTQWPIDNTASVTGYWMYPAWSVSDSDSVSVGLTPVYSLSIEKTADKTAAFTGESVHYTLTITNTGNQTLTGISIQDINNYGYATLPSYQTTLAPGDSFDVEYDISMTEADPKADYTFDNTASAWAAEVQQPVTDSWSVAVTQSIYGLSVTKTADPTSVWEGEDVTYTITVENTGNRDLGSIAFTDDQFSAENRTLSLVAGADTTFTYTKTMAEVDADSDFVNTATVSAMNGSVTDSDEATVTVKNKTYGLTIDKQITNAPAIIYEGDTVSYKITVTNTGNQPLTDIVVSDDRTDLSANNPISLSPGASKEISYSIVIPEVDADGTFTNTATAVSASHSLSDSDSETVKVVNRTYGLSIDKSIVSAPSPLYEGDSVSYQLVVTNTGNQDLDDVIITDDQYDLTAKGYGAGNAVSINAGQSVTINYSINMPDVSADGDFTNTATASSASHNLSESDSATVSVVNRTYDLSIDKQVVSAPSPLYEGDTVSYKIIVTNNGNQVLTDIVVSDDNADLNAYNPITLQPGESKEITYDITMAEVDADGTFTNTATASSASRELSRSDSETVNVVNRTNGLSIDKSIVSAPSPLYEGDSVSYKLVVTNTGNQDLTDVIITDDQFDLTAKGYGAANPASISAGQSVEITYSIIMPEVDADGDFTNTAAAASASRELSVSDSATVNVTDRTYGLSLIKEAAQSEVYEGEDVDYTVTITNFGNQPIYGINFTDDQFPDMNQSFDLDGGETKVITYTKTMALVDADTNFVNTASASDSDHVYTASDDATVLVKNRTYDWSVTKTADQSAVFEGESVTYTVTITNYGNQPLSGIVVSDSQYDLSGYGPYDLAAAGEAGDSVSFQYTMVMAEVDADANFENTVTATWEETPVTDDETVLVKNRTYIMDITKTASAGEVYLGADVTFTITVKNTGNQPLSGIKVTDALLGYDSSAADPNNTDIIGTLNPGDEWSVQLTRTMDTLGEFTNTARVEGLTENSLFEPKEDTATVSVIPVPEYAVSISKTVDSTAISTGQPSTFTITVKNVGNQDLDQVLVKDEALGFSQTISLTAGETKVFTMTTTYPAAGTYVNIASAEDPTGELFDTVTSQATVTVTDVIIEDPETPGGDVDEGDSDNPHTAQSSNWIVIIGILATLMTAMVFMVSKHRRTLARRHR